MTDKPQDVNISLRPVQPGDTFFDMSSGDTLTIEDAAMNCTVDSGGKKAIAIKGVPTLDLSTPESAARAGVAVSLGEQLLYNAERLANGEAMNPCVKFMLDVRRKDGSTTMMWVSLTHARQADAEVSFAGKTPGPTWYGEQE